MTTPLFMLRCVQLGISIADLDLLTVGSSRDKIEWKEQASQADMDRF